LSRIQKIALVAALASSCLGSASAQSFQGRLANGTPSASCEVSGPNKCAMFFNPTLNITILNNWNIGSGFWSVTAASGSAQALAASAGVAASGLTGWVLPTGNGYLSGGDLNQYRSIWNQVGASFAGLSGQFDGFQSGIYWSSTALPAFNSAWNSRFLVNGIDQGFIFLPTLYKTVAVRPGDVALIPEPQTYAMLLAGLGAVLVAVRRRRATPTV